MTATRRIGLNTSKNAVAGDVPYQAPPAGSTLSGQLPLPMAPVVSPKSLTPQERKVLEAAGWKPGDPLPADLANQPAVQALMREIQAEDAATLLRPPKDFVGAKIPDPVEVPPERLGEFNQILRDAQQAQQRQEAVRSGITGKEPPGVAEALMAANAASWDNVGGTIDDRASDTYAGTNVRKSSELPPPPKLELQNCPHCDWPLEKADPTEPTLGDRQQFLDSFLAGAPFVKTFDMFDGAYQVTIRQLNGDEEEACYQQALQDFQAGQIQIMDVMERTMRYRTCLQLTKVVAKNRPTLDLPENLAAWIADEPAGDSPIRKTPTLHKIRDTVYREVLPTESMVRAVTYVVSQFNRLSLKLESQVFTPDFLKRTA